MEMAYITKESAQKYYNELLKNYQYETDYLYNKVPILKNLMEHEVLREITNIVHFKSPYETGQLKWLNDRMEKKDKNGETINGFIPRNIITGIELLFAERNVAEHEQRMTYAAYLGLFNKVAETIEFFSGIDRPENIKNICNNRKTPNVKKVNNNIKNKVCSDYYFVNTGIGKDILKVRRWKYNRDYNFISAGDGNPFLANIRRLQKGYKIFAYKSGKSNNGYLGFGEVEAVAVPVKKFFEKTPDDNPWKKHKNADELIVKVKWIKTFNENEAKWKKGLMAYRTSVCPLTDETTLEYLCKEFEIEDEGKIDSQNP